MLMVERGSVHSMNMIDWTRARVDSFDEHFMGTTGTCGLDVNKRVNLSGSAPNHSKSQIAKFRPISSGSDSAKLCFVFPKKKCHHGKLGIPGSASGRNAASPSAAWLFSTRWLACNFINSQSHIPRAIKSIGMIYPTINPNSEPMTTSIYSWGLLIELLVSIIVGVSRYHTLPSGKLT